MPQNLKELCRLISRCKEENGSQSSTNVTDAYNVSVDGNQERVLEYSLRSIQMHRPIGKVMIVLIGECGTGKSTTLHNLFNDGKLYEDDKCQTRRVTEYSKLITCSQFKTHLSFVDTPGIFDTEEAQNEENMGELHKFRAKHSGFRQIPKSTVYPNLVLITVKASDTRLDDRDSFFTQTLRAIDGTNLIDPRLNNLIVVATSSAQITTNAEEFVKEKRRIRYVISKVVHNVLGILNMRIVFIENEPMKYNLRKHGNSDSFELPDGELTPLNLCEAICDHLKSSGDVLGSLISSRYFKENCREKKHAVTTENMNLIFEEPGEDFEKEANIIVKEIKAFDQEGFHRANQYVGCGYSLRKECTVTSQISPTALRSEKVNVIDKCFKIMSFQNEREYKIHRLQMYGMDSEIELNLCPEVSSFGKWEHDENVGERDKGKYKDKIVISFVHYERLGIITFDKKICNSHLVGELRKDLEALPSRRCFDRLCGFTEKKIEQFYSFFDMWGTHYIKEVGVGGWMRVDCCIPSGWSNEEKRRLEETIKNQISLLSNGQEVDVDLENIVADGYVRIKFHGGIPPDVTKLGDLTQKKFTEWEKSLKDHPVELEYSTKLQSYEVFLDDENKKTSLREATLNYLKGCPDRRVATRGRGMISQNIAARLGLGALVVIAIMCMIVKRGEIMSFVRKFFPRKNTDIEEAITKPTPIVSQLPGDQTIKSTVWDKIKSFFSGRHMSHDEIRRQMSYTV